MLYEHKNTNKKKIIEQRCIIDLAIDASDVVNCSSQIESVRNPNNYLFNRFSVVHYRTFFIASRANRQREFLITVISAHESCVWAEMYLSDLPSTIVANGRPYGLLSAIECGDKSKVDFGVRRVRQRGSFSYQLIES